VQSVKIQSLAILLIVSHLRCKKFNPMSYRNKPNTKQLLSSAWSTDQDCFLIENNHLTVDQLAEILPYQHDEIIARKRQLGLLRRDFYMKKLHDL